MGHTADEVSFSAPGHARSTDLKAKQNRKVLNGFLGKILNGHSLKAVSRHLWGSVQGGLSDTGGPMRHPPPAIR